MEVSVRPPKHHYDVIMTSFLSLCFQISIFVEHDKGYQPSKFQCSRMSGLNFMEGGGGWKPPSQCYKKIKKASAYRVKIKIFNSGE